MFMYEFLSKQHLCLRSRLRSDIDRKEQFNEINRSKRAARKGHHWVDVSKNVSEPFPWSCR